jgi:hypothetical protein
MPNGATAQVYNPSRGLFSKGRGDDPITRQYRLAERATEQQVGDYGNIMRAYRNLATQAPSARYTGAVENLGDLARTGGYSAEDIQNLRARAVSPIRSIYSGAEREVSRQAGLQGGYSPGLTAARAKMAREQSEQTGQAMTDVNARLAEMIARGRQQAAPAYAAATRAMETEIPMESLRGQTSLYGTTPALSELFGRQAVGAAQLQNQINQQRGGLRRVGRSISRN